MINLIPPQFRVATFLSIIGIMFGCGWSVNGWRLSGKIEGLQADLSTCRGNKATLTASIQDQNEKITQLGRKSEEKLKASQEALAAAQGGKIKSDLLVAQLKKQRGSTCFDAEQLIDEGLGL